MMVINKKGIASMIGMAGIVLATIPLIGGDNAVFLKWWLVILALGIGFLPLTSQLFAGFEDRGWLFSKAIGVAVSGFLVWALVCIGVLKFNTVTTVIVTVVSVAACWGGCWLSAARRGRKLLPENVNLNLILFEELIFLAVFFLWTYLAGFHPEAHGTEKFMDYGFMAAMMRSESLPAPDIWYSLKDTNYYYGGQYFAVFLTKLTMSQVEDTYNLMRTLVAGLLSGMSFSIVCQMIRGMEWGFGKRFHRAASVGGGLLAGGAVVFAGNFHYVVYGVIGKFLGWEKGTDYWFPNSTRYIGYNPDTSDKCIHEFPSYSFVLGDLHAHVVNTMFVIVVIGLMLAWILNVRKKGEQEKAVFTWKRCLLQPHVIAGGFFIGLFHFTNYWDFVIYFTVIVIVSVYCALYQYRLSWRQILPTVGIQAAEAFLIGTVTALPFTMTFETMVSGIGIAENHTKFYQWLILWGLPAVLVLAFTVLLLLQYRRMTKKKACAEETRDTQAGRSDFFAWAGSSDIFAFIIGMCALGLVLIPELVYVRDIYENGYARSNTMFKLTYQAFILFGLAMSYVIVRLLSWKGMKIPKVIGGLGLILLLPTFGYFGNAVNSWFGPVLDKDEYRCLDATRYLENVFAEDAPAIRWLNENIEGNPVVLEAPGDSYSDYQRVSAMTGLPTVLGWYVHEWLWRGDPGALNSRASDIEAIYTSEDYRQAEELLEKYDVSYIYVGKYEREKYSRVSERLLQSLGEIVFQSENADGTLGDTYVIKVDRAK